MAQEVMLTVLAQIHIQAHDDDAYIAKRDKIIEKLEKMGFDVNIEDETYDEESDPDSLEDDEE